MPNAKEVLEFLEYKEKQKMKIQYKEALEYFEYRKKSIALSDNIQRFEDIAICALKELI